MTNDLHDTALTLVSSGKGILAADETAGTLTKRFEARTIESTADTRRSYREMFFTTPHIADFISGVILQDETIRQSSAQGVPLADVLSRQGIIPGIKVTPGRSMTRALAGPTTSGPAAVILSPSTSTDQLACGRGLTPSNTRSGRRTKVSANAGAATHSRAANNSFLIIGASIPSPAA